MYISGVSIEHVLKKQWSNIPCIAVLLEFLLVPGVGLLRLRPCHIQFFQSLHGILALVIRSPSSFLGRSSIFFADSVFGQVAFLYVCHS